MKTIVMTLCLFATLSASAKAPSIQERVNRAAQILAGISEGSDTIKVKPNTDPKAMLLEYALREQLVETEDDFEANWVGDSGDAWGADSMNWGLENLAGAQSYIEGALQTRLEEGEGTDQDKIKYADGMMASSKAFTILRSLKSVKYGVAPTGAVQCGVTFPSLFIIDTENGEMHQIIMEGSGC